MHTGGAALFERLESLEAAPDLAWLGAGGTA
jgi:hypothetical protein